MFTFGLISRIQRARSRPPVSPADIEFGQQDVAAVFPCGIHRLLRVMAGSHAGLRDNAADLPSQRKQRQAAVIHTDNIQLGYPPFLLLRKYCNT